MAGEREQLLCTYAWQRFVESSTCVTAIHCVFFVFHHSSEVKNNTNSTMKAFIIVITLSLASVAMGQSRSGQTAAEVATCAPHRSCKSWCWLEMPCPVGQQRYGDGSACSGGGKPNCDLGFCSNQPNGGMPSCPVTQPTPAALGKSSDVAKQMIAIIDQNMQKFSESYNEVKGMQSKAAVAAAASQMLYDSVASEVARLKQDMEKLQNQAVTSKAQCQSDSNSHLVASVSHERAVTTAKDVKSIDQELAVIQQLRQKLQEVHIIHSYLFISMQTVLTPFFFLQRSAHRHQSCTNIQRSARHQRLCRACYIRCIRQHASFDLSYARRSHCRRQEWKALC